MSSKIEQIIEELENYIDGCKYAKFSNDNIIVNKDEIDSLINELRSKTPEEIRRYQKIISNQEAIMADAKAKAEAIINEAHIQTNELVSEHQIMQQAYAQANEIVELATKQAQDILDNATMEANAVKAAAIQYTDDILANLENIVNHTISQSTNDYTNLINNLNKIEEIVSSNRASLYPPDEAEDTTQENAPAEQLDVI